MKMLKSKWGDLSIRKFKIKNSDQVDGTVGAKDFSGMYFFSIFAIELWRGYQSVSFCQIKLFINRIFSKNLLTLSSHVIECFKYLKNKVYFLSISREFIGYMC